MTNKRRPPIYPEQFGAIGDGIADDTDAITRALLESENKTLVLSRVYRCSQILIDLPMTLRGEGGRIESNTQTDEMVIYVDSSDVEITGLEIDGQSVARGGIYVDVNRERVKISRNKLHNFDSNANVTEGIFFRSGCHDISIYANEVYNLTNSTPFTPNSVRGIRGSIVGDIRGVRIESNLVHDIFTREDSDGIVIQDSGVNDDLDVVVANNTVYRCGKRAIKIQSPGVKVFGNAISMPDIGESSVPRSCIEINAHSCSVRNNSIYAPDSVVDGVIIIEPGATKDTTVSDNDLRLPIFNPNINCDAIRVDASCNNLNITGNNVNCDTRFGVNLAGNPCYNVNISGNNFQRCGNLGSRAVIHLGADAHSGVTIQNNSYSVTEGYFLIASGAKNLQVDSSNVGDGTQVAFSSGTLIGKFHASQNHCLGDGTDERFELQNAFLNLNANGGVIEFDGTREYRATRVEIANKSNITIDLGGATIKASDSGSVLSNDCVLKFTNCDNLVVRNGTIDGNRDGRGTLSSSANSHCVWIHGGSNITFENVHCINSAKDGFYLYAGGSESDESTYPTNVSLINCTADNSYRSGVRVVNSRGLVIQGGSYTGSNGTGVESGIEVDSAGATATPSSQGISIRDVTVSDNDGCGIGVTSTYITAGCVTIDGCHIENCRKGAIVANADVKINNCHIKDFSNIIGATSDRYIVRSTNSRGRGVCVTNCLFENITHTSSYCIHLSGNSSGSHSVSNCTFRNAQYFIYDGSSGSSISCNNFGSTGITSQCVQLRGSGSQLVNNYFESGAHNPVYASLDSANQLAHISGNIFMEHNQNADPSEGLIRFNSGTAVISGNQFFRSGSQSGQTSWTSILVQGLYCIVHGNRNYNLGSVVVDAGTSTIVYHNMEGANFITGDAAPLP